MDAAIDDSLNFFDEIYGLIPDTFKQVPKEYLPAKEDNQGKQGKK